MCVRVRARAFAFAYARAGVRMMCMFHFACKPGCVSDGSPDGYGCRFPWQWKTGLEIAGNCPSTGNCRQSAPSDARSEDWPYMPSELGDIRRFQHHIKSSIRLVEFVCQEPRNLGSSPYALWAHGQRLIRFPPPSVDCKMGSEIPGISISTFQRGNAK